MRQLLSILAGVVIGAVVLIGVLLGLHSIGAYGEGIQDTGPGMVLVMVMLFGAAPLLFTTLISQALPAWPKARWVKPLAGGAFSAAAFGGIVFYFGYSAQMGLAVVVAAFIAGAVAAVVALVLGDHKKSRGRV